MCPGCRQIWTALQILWSTVYVVCGAAQLIAGIFFLISTPTFQLHCNIWTGGWNVVMGIAGGMLSCLGRFSARRQEFLLYIAVSILVVNCVNVILSEWGLYFTDTTVLLKQHPNHTLIDYACFATRIATATVIIVSFLDSQFAFCSMQIKSSLKTTTTINNNNKTNATVVTTLTNKKKKKLHDSHEQVSDIEYIIPRPKSAKAHTPAYYSQSWVFDADSAATTSSSQIATSYLKILENGTINNHQIKQNGIVLTDDDGNNNQQQTLNLIDNPVVHIEEASDDSNSNQSDRKLCHMRSFSRSASPILLSTSSSNINLNQTTTTTTTNPPPIYECLETIYRTRLNTGDNSDLNREEIHYQAPQTMVMRRVESVSPHVEQVQYASLMKELQRAISNKKETNSISPQSDSTTISDKTPQTDSTKSSSRHESTSRSDCKSSSDTEFSKELEAALQLIQDLESPNTIDTTPSEPKSSLNDCKEQQQRPLSVWRNSDASESEKTLSAVGSFTEISSPINECPPPDLYTFKSPTTTATTTTTTNNGKNSSVIIRYPESQSTSGYSSPTNVSNGETPPSWSTTSSLNGSNDILMKPLSYSIHNAKSSTVISLFTPSPPQSNKTKSITLVNITGDNTPILPLQQENNNQQLNVMKEVKSSTTTPTTTTPPTNDSKSGGNQMWKSLLRKKKSTVPKLCPELEGAIIKSESLAYLSELELLARHQRNKEIHREIEERVIQQLGTPRTESNC